MSALEKLKKLQAIQFRYKEEFDVDQRLRAGFSAQQVREVIPEAVFEEDGNGDLMPTTSTEGLSVFYDYDSNDDIQPRA